MYVRSNLQWERAPLGLAGRPFAHGGRLIAALDVEWTKNFRVKGASRPFCYSWALVNVADRFLDEDGGLASFGYKSVYVEREEEIDDLIDTLESDIASSEEIDSLVFSGHQLCSDLSVVKAASGRPLPALETLYDAWRNRSKTFRVVDTRYDVDELIPSLSRRLVDVASALKLDVTQPELRGSSMTRMHQLFLKQHDTLVSEKLAVLNLRHSLSTAMIAAILLGALPMKKCNVNDLLYQEAAEEFSYLCSSEFRLLLS